MNETALQKLWSGVSAHFDVGSYDEFKTKMSSPEGRKKFYAAASDKVDLGPADEYERKLSSPAQSDSQKKSPDVSADGLATGSQVSPDGSSTNNKPFDSQQFFNNTLSQKIADAPAQPQAPTSTDDVNQAAATINTLVGTDPHANDPNTVAMVGTTQAGNQAMNTYATDGQGGVAMQHNVANNGSSLDNTPLVDGKQIQRQPIQKERTPEDVKSQTSDAAKTIIDDLTTNVDNLPQEYKNNIQAIPFTSPGNIAHDVSDPHGNPEIVGGYIISREAQLRQKMQQEIANNTHTGAGQRDVPMDPEQTQAENAIREKYDAQISQLRNAGSRIIDLQLVNNEVKKDGKYDPLAIGIQKAALLGNKQAQQDLSDYNNGKPINPDDRLKYQAEGFHVLEIGRANAAANGQDAVSENIGKITDKAEETLKKENPEAIKKQIVNNIGNYIYDNQNKIHTSIYSRESVSQDEMENAAKALGYKFSEYKDIDPSEIPRSAGPLNTLAQSAWNSIGSPLYEGGMGVLADVGIANRDAVNKRFHPGWEDEPGGVGSALTGSVPTHQQSFDKTDASSYVHAMAKGVGDLVGILTTAEVGGGALKAAGYAGKAEEAVQAEKALKAANFGTAALQGYNSAYENSLSVIGDKPEDEIKRHLYATANGLIGGALMMVDPQAKIGEDILGGTSAGRSLLNTIKKEGIEGLTKDEFQSKLAKATSQALEASKHVGFQAGIAAGNKVAENATNMIFNPDGDYNLTEGVGDAAMSGGISMLLPSLAAGYQHPRNQSALNQSIVHEVSSDPYKFKKQIQDNVASGKMSQAEANTANTVVDKLQYIAQNQVPEDNLTGAKLTEPQRAAYTWNLLKNNDLEGRLKKAESTNDPAQIQTVKSAISALSKEREEVLGNAGQPHPAQKPLPPKEEQEIPEEHKQDYHDLSNFAKDNGFTVTSTTGGQHNVGSKHAKGLAIDVRTRDKSDEEVSALIAKAKDAGYIVHDERFHPDGQKVWSGAHVHLELPSGEKIISKNKESKENSIPLNSKEGEEPITKTNDNEKSSDNAGLQSNEGGQSNTNAEEGTGREGNSEVRQAAGLEGSQERQGGELTTEEDQHGNTEQQEPKGEPAVSVSETTTKKKVRRKLVVDEEAPAVEESKQESVTAPTHKSEFAAWDQGDMEGQPKATHEQQIKDAPANEKIGGGESFEDFRDRIKGAWEGLKETAKDKTLLVTHSGVMRMIESADEHGWDNTEALRKVYNEEKEPPVGEIIHHEGKNGEILVARHGQSEDNADNLLRTKDVELTDKGRTQAKTQIADKLKEEGITPSEIVSSDLPRAKETADIVHKEFTNNSTSDPRIDRMDALTKEIENQRDVLESMSEKTHGDDFYHQKQKVSDLEKERHAVTKEIIESNQKQKVKKNKNSVATGEEKQPESFETSKGSVYKYTPEGKTQRYKTADGTAHEPQDLTAFAKFKDPDQEQRFLSGIQKSDKNGTKVYLVDKDGKIYHTNEEAKGKDVRLALVDAKKGEVLETAKTTLTPTEGYQVFDQRRYEENGQEMREKHIGNEVTKINYKEDASTQSKEQQQKGPEQSSEPEHARIEQAGNKEAPASSEGSDSNVRGKEEEIEEGPKESARDARIKDIDLQLKQQRASQQHEANLRDQAEKAKDIEKSNRHNANWYKKKERIEKLEEEKHELQNTADKETREAGIKKAYNEFADKLEKKWEEKKKNNEGVLYSSILGINPKIGDHVANFVVTHVLEGIRELANIHIAIDRAIRLAKEKFGAEADDLTKEDNAAIKDHLEGLGIKNPVVDHEPVLPIDHEEYAKDLLADIKSGETSHADIIQEIRNEVIENRASQPVSDHVSENVKAKILKYIDWHLQNDITSIKNDVTRLRRAQLGLDEEISSARKEFGETWDEAKEKIENNPQAPLHLIDELSKKARPLNDVENAMLLHHQNTKEIELQKQNDNINKSSESGDKGALIEAKLNKARLLDELQQIYDINKAVGTENGRGLAARRMMVDRKYSLVNMLAEKRATANDGKALSEEQQQEVEKLHEKINTTQQAFDDYVKKAESQIVDLQRKALSGNLKDKKTASSKLREWADKLEQSSKNQAYSSPIPITPKMIADGIRLVAAGVEAGEKLIDIVKKAVDKGSKDNPGIDEGHLEKEINGALIDSGILEPSTERKKAKDMSGLFSDGKMDTQAIRLKSAADRAKSEFDHRLKKDSEKNIPVGNKVLDLFVKTERAFKLSSPLTMAKLMAAGFARLAIHPAEEVVGGIYSKIFPKLAKGAIGEGGGLNAEAYAKAIASGFKMWGEDFKQIMKTGKSDIDVAFGGAQHMSPEALDFFGHLHSAEKAPFKRVIMEYSLQKRLKNAIANGVDVADPVVMTSIGLDAYKDANRAIFMQDNAVADFYNKKVKELEKIDPKTGKPESNAKYAISKAMQFLIPFAKIPSNIVAESARNIYGLPVGLTKAIYHAFKGDLETLQPEEKDMIMRNLKKGTIGAAALLYGFYQYNKFGGFYQPGKDWKKDDDEPDWNGMEIGGVKIPPTYMEAPIFQAMQMGATYRKVLNHEIRGEEEGIPAAVWASISGLAEENPLLSQPMHVTHLFNSSYERQQFIGEMAKSTLVPAGVSYLAKATDPADKGSFLGKVFAPENKRKSPRTIEDHIKSGIPYLREDLESKEPEEEQGKY